MNEIDKDTNEKGKEIIISMVRSWRADQRRAMRMTRYEGRQEVIIAAGSPEHFLEIVKAKGWGMFDWLEDVVWHEFKCPSAGKLFPGHFHFFTELALKK